MFLAKKVRGTEIHFVKKKKSGFVIELVVSKWIHQVVKDLRKRTLRGLYMVRTGLGNTELHLKNKS